MAIDRIHDYIVPGKRAHLVGIGGVSMSPLAEVLQGEGLVITGSDVKESLAVEHLRSLGIPVVIGHLPESVEGKDLVIRTAAVHDSNPEIAAAHALGIPVFERAQAWGSIMRRYENALCISGTHGKTTTTSMCTHIAMAARVDPTVMIGGTLPILGTGHRVGKGKTIILVSHSMDEIARNVDRILVLKNAHVLMQGTPAEVFARGEELLSAGLDVPQITRIAMELKRRGVDIDPAVYTVEALERQLLALRKGGAGC